jgi:hypothetical protein
LHHLIEYALGLNPVSPDRGALSVVVENGRVQVVYRRPSAVTDLEYRIEWADRIGLAGAAWTGAGVSQEILSDDGTVRTIRASVPSGDNGSRFVRLNVTWR